jgi:hypothetical protein
LNCERTALKQSPWRVPPGRDSGPRFIQAFKNFSGLM